MSEKNDNEDGDDYGEDFDDKDNDNQDDNQNNDNDDNKDPLDDENNQDDLLEEEPLEDNNDNQEQAKLNLTIGDTNGMDENEQLRKWKKQAENMSEAIKELRAKNNLYRNKLKKLGDKAEKLVQSNVRRQKNTELKQADKHSYLNEQKIVLEIMKNNKSPAEFKEYLDQRIIESLVKVYKEKQSNDDLKAKIHQIKDKNRNIDFNDQITELTNQLTAIKAQLDAEKKDETKLKEITKKQEIEIQQMTSNYDYQSKKEELQNEIRKMKEDIKQMQKVELENQKRYREQNELYVDLQKRYRQTCQMANKICDDTNLLQNKQEEQVQKQGDQENQNKTLQQQVYIKNHEQIQKIKLLKEQQLQKQRELKKDDKLKDDITLLEEYRANKDAFKTRVESVERKNAELEKKNKEFIEKKKKLNEEIIRLSEEAFELDKQCKKKEQDAKVVVRKLNEAQRKLNVTDKKPIIEEVTSQIYQKPLFQQFGQLNKSETALPFDDSKNLDWSYNALKISKIIVYVSKQDLIQGIEIKYDQQDLEEGENKGKQNKHLATTVNETKDKPMLEIDKDDILSYVSGFYNSEQIIFLKFETQKKKSIQVGNIKYKDAQTKDFRIEIKSNQNILGFTGILDYTSESKTPNERFLVAIGLQIKNKEQDIQEKKRIKKLDKEEKSKQVQIRRGQYILKKHKVDNLSLVNKSVQQLNSSSSDRDYKLIREDKIRLERVKLGLNSAKLFSPTTYKASEYKIEEEKRRELSEKRRVEIEKFRLQTQSAKALPAIQTDQNKGQSDKKGNPNATKDKSKTVPKKK